MSERDLRIDFLRGLALLMIFVDHSPWNPLTLLTLRSWSFGDAAELFFFLSGYVAALVYGRTLAQSGFLAATARIYRRAWDIYATQIVLLVFLVALLATTADAYHTRALVDYFRINAFLDHTDTMVLQALLLRYQPAYLDILPAYIAFFIVLPFGLVLLKRNVWIALGLSFALYLGVQFWGWTPRSAPDDVPWLFNPCAWQLLFTLGAAFGSGHLSRVTPILDSRWTIGLAALIAVPAAIITGSAVVHTFIPAIPAVQTGPLQVGKESLQYLRIVDFLALAVLARRFMPSSTALGSNAATRAIMRCGQHSLAIFGAGVLLAVSTDIFCAGWSQAALVLANVAGIGVLIGFAALLDWAYTASTGKLQYAGVS
ncbi:MAG TPA: OpgC domain-containing protein [Rhizomicrobium sp.]